MAKPQCTRVTIVRGDYTIQTFVVNPQVAHAPFDLTLFDTVVLTIKTNEGTLSVATIDNDEDNDLLNGVVVFRIPSIVSQNLPVGRWPLSVCLHVGSERTTPIVGTAIVVDSSGNK